MGQAGGQRCLQLLLFGLGIALMVDLQGLPGTIRVGSHIQISHNEHH